MDKIIDRVDIEKIIDRVDVEKIIDRVDMQKIIDRVDINAIVDKVDIDALVEQTELGSIIARSTTGVLTEILDVIRAQGVGLDDFILRWGNRLVGRGEQGRGLARRSAPARRAEGGHPVTTVPVPSAEMTVGRQGHYAGAVSRLVAFAADVGASWGVYTLGVALLNAARQAGDRALLHPRPTTRSLALVVLAVWEFVYFAYQWAVSGKTLGMAVFGLQVVTTQGGPISGRQAVLRTIGLGLTLLTLGIGFLGIVYQRERRALDDFIAGTAVVYDWDARAARLRWMARQEGPPAHRRPSHSDRARRSTCPAVPGSGGAHLRCRACPSPKSAGPTPRSPSSRSTGPSA